MTKLFILDLLFKPPQPISTIAIDKLGLQPQRDRFTTAMVGVEGLEPTKKDEFRQEAQDWLDRAAALEPKPTPSATTPSDSK